MDPIEFIWFDHAVEDGGSNHLLTAKLVKSLQPSCFVGFNHGEPAGDLRLGEMGLPSALNDPSGAGYALKMRVPTRDITLLNSLCPCLVPFKERTVGFTQILPMTIRQSLQKRFWNYSKGPFFVGIFFLSTQDPTGQDIFVPSMS